MRSSEETLNLITQTCESKNLRFSLGYNEPAWIAFFVDKSKWPEEVKYVGKPGQSAAEAVNSLLDKVAADGR